MRCRHLDRRDLAALVDDGELLGDLEPGRAGDGDLQLQLALAVRGDPQLGAHGPVHGRIVTRPGRTLAIGARAPALRRTEAFSGQGSGQGEEELLQLLDVDAVDAITCGEALLETTRDDGEAGLVEGPGDRGHLGDESSQSRPSSSMRSTPSS